MVSGGWRFKGWVKTVGGLAYVMTTSSHPLSLLYNDNQGWRPRLYEKCYMPGFRSRLFFLFCTLDSNGSGFHFLFFQLSSGLFLSKWISYK